MGWMRVLGLVLLGGVFVGGQAAAAAGPEAGAKAAPSHELTLDEARAIVADVESRWPRDSKEPLQKPTSLNDVERILKRDQVTLFPAGLAFASGSDDERALSLHGQIQLAWGEAYITLVEILRTLHGTLLREAKALESREAPLSTVDAEQLEFLRGAAVELERVWPAFARLIPEHLEAGHAKADALIKKYPESYRGFRVAADYYRLVEDWPAFEDAIIKVRKLNPDSNGLRFLRGAEALRNRHNRGSARKFYEQALTEDPEFVRARAHLLMTSGDPQFLYDQLQLLKALNPNHQIVALAGRRIEQAYKAWKKAAD